MDYATLAEVLTNAANRDQAAQMSAYMRDQFQFLGIRSPERKRLCKPFFGKARTAAQADWEFIDSCWDEPFREFQYVAVDYLAIMQQKLRPSDVPRIKRLITTRSWWDTADSLDRVVGGIALAYPEVNETLLAWSVDENLWLRRVAIDHQLLRKTRTDTDLLDQILVSNLGQSEFFITKAIGWALRDYSKTDPDWVRSFLNRHRGELAPLSVREASKYL